MNVKNNRRRRQSMERIESAFITLLQEKELHQITVSDLCKVCQLNRSTFYANYIDVYDLADRVRQRLEKEVMALYHVDNMFSIHGDGFLKLLRHIRNNQAIYLTYFKLGYDRLYQPSLSDLRQMEQYFEGSHIAYHIEFFKSGFNAVVKLWLVSGCRESPEEISAIIDSEYRDRRTVTAGQGQSPLP